MKNFWSILLLITVLQSLTVSILAGGHHGHESNIAHILAAGLIVQLLSRSHHHGHHHHHKGRHSGGEIHSEYSPYNHGGGWGGEGRVNPESTLGSSAWAQRVPMEMAQRANMEMVQRANMEMAQRANMEMAQRAPMEMTYAQPQYKDPVVESYSHSQSHSVPYYYNSMPSTPASDLW